MTKEPTKKYLRLLAYLSGFFLTIHMAFPSYFNAQFLGQFLPDNKIGITYAISSLLTIALITYIPRVIRKIGLLKTIYATSIVTLCATLPMAFIKNPAILIFLFIIYYSLGFVVRYALDIYLEKVSDNRNTGDIRGIFLTFINIAWLVSPFLAGTLISDRGYSTIFLISAIALTPVIYLTIFQLKEQEHHRQIKTPRVRVALKKLYQGKSEAIKNIRNILITDFLLNLFYAIMVVYTALYLEEYLKITKVDIGIIFTIMLIPFVIFELPLGRLADKKLGEKEILTAGFVVAGLATIIVPFISSPTIWLWGLILFFTRTGACAIEIMKETYLFKKITEEDTDILSLSRNMQPFSYIIGPGLASIFIYFFDLKYIFLLLGIIMIYGTRYSLALKDTK